MPTRSPMSRTSDRSAPCTRPASSLPKLPRDMTTALGASLVHASGFHSGLHLSEGELESAERVCPFCLSESGRFPAFRLQSDPDVDLLSCESCGACSASRMPTPDALRSYYAS